MNILLLCANLDGLEVGMAKPYIIYIILVYVYMQIFI